MEKLPQFTLSQPVLEPPVHDSSSRADTEKGEPLTNSEEAWAALEERVRVEFRETVLSIIKNTLKDNPEAQESLIERCWNAEHQFVKKVWDAVHSLTESGAAHTYVLFDIDDTIGNSDMYQDYETSRTVLRPSLRPLMEMLRETLGEDAISFGLLTTRGRLTEQLADPNHLKSVADFIDPEKCYSTRVYYQEWAEGADYETWGRLGEDGTPEELRERCGDIIDPSIDLHSTEISPIDSMKLVMLTRIMQEDKEGSYVVVDDIDYPDLIRKEGGRARGVKLGEKETFSLTEHIGVM